MQKEQIILIVNLKKNKLYTIFKALFLLKYIIIFMFFTIILCLSIGGFIAFIAFVLPILLVILYFQLMPLIIRKIVCYDEYFEIIRIFRKTRVNYADLYKYYFVSCRKVFLNKDLYLCYNYVKFVTIINCSIFNPNELEKFLELLNNKGINEEISDIDDSLFYSLFALIKKANSYFKFL